MTDFIEYNLGTIAANMPDRRERIATAALAGLLSQSQYWSPHQAACEAIEHADALIAELDKEVKP